MLFVMVSPTLALYTAAVLLMKESDLSTHPMPYPMLMNSALLNSNVIVVQTYSVS
jgi:hypothetical protein